ncbi:ABC transporter ATP-binding protein [Pseudarthrobacter oxydans]
MKRQAIADIWRHAGPGWGDNPGIRSITPIALAGFEEASATCHGGIAVVCGANSSGKTRLLAALTTAVRDSQTTVVDVETVGIDSDKVSFLDTAWQLQRQVISLSGDVTLPERKAQAGSFRVKESDLRRINYVLGDEIEAIKLFELDSTDDAPLLEDIAEAHPTAKLSVSFKEDVIPYFEVTARGLTRGSLQLSQGELTVLTLYWALISAEEGSLLVMDEPDAFLSPQSGRRVFDLIAHHAYEQKCPCVITSHSYLALSTLPVDHLLVLKTNLQRQTIVETGSKNALWKVLQVGPTRRVVFAVEDEAGRQWLHALFRLLDFEHSEVSAVWNVRGESNVALVANFPSGGEADIAFWGVLDGDRRDKRNTGQHMILPGSKSPEAVILDILKSGDARVMGQGITPEKVEEVLAAHTGEDPHEQVIAVAHRLGFDLPSFRERIWTAWLLETEDGQAELTKFGEALSAVTLPIS